MFRAKIKLFSILFIYELSDEPPHFEPMIERPSLDLTLNLYPPILAPNYTPHQ